MPESEVHMIDSLSKMEGRVDDLSYVQQMERNDVDKRLRMLFKPGENQSGKDFDAAEALKEAYMTVNEDETTDTTSGIEDESLLTRKEGEKKKPVEAAEKPKRTVEAGIKSSDDEDAGEAQTAVSEKSPIQE